MTPVERSTVVRLASAYCDSALEERELTALQDLLRPDAACRDLFKKLVRMHADLAWEKGPVRPANLLQPNLAVSEPVHRAVGVKPTHSRVVNLLRHAASFVPGGEFTIGSLLMLVVVAAFWGLVTQFFYVRHRADIASEFDVPHIRESANVRWSDGIDTDSAEALIAKHQRLGIETGRIELQLKQGATLAIEAPAEWSIDGDNQATLKRGKLVAKVPQQAIGFRLKTPTAEIVDLGTEFGVIAEDSQTTGVYVFRGEVDVSSRNDTRPATSKPESHADQIRLRAGESTWVQSRGTTTRSLPKLAAANFPHRPSTGSAILAERHVAYVVPPITEGWGGYNGPVAMDFDVLKPIDVHRLGVFDLGCDGFAPSTRLTVKLWTRDNAGTPLSPEDDRAGQALATAVFTGSVPGQLRASSRFLELGKPVRLKPGSYTIVVSGFTAEDPLGNSRGEETGTAAAPWFTDDGNDELQFIGASRFSNDPSFEFPLNIDLGPANRYAAGTFEFSTAR